MYDYGKEKNLEIYKTETPTYIQTIILKLIFLFTLLPVLKTS